MSTLYELTGDYLKLLEMIEQGDIEEDVLKDTLEGITGEIEIKADGYAKVMKEIEVQSNGLKAEIDRLTSRKRTLDNSIAYMKKSLETSMIATGKKKFKTDLFSFNVQKNPATVVITGDVPDKYLIEQEPKIDKKAIKDLLKTENVDFAHLEQTESLRIR